MAARAPECVDRPERFRQIEFATGFGINSCISYRQLARFRAQQGWSAAPAVGWSGGTDRVRNRHLCRSILMMPRARKRARLRETTSHGAEAGGDFLASQPQREFGGAGPTAGIQQHAREPPCPARLVLLWILWLRWRRPVCKSPTNRHHKYVFVRPARDCGTGNRNFPQIWRYFWTI